MKKYARDIVALFEMAPSLFGSKLLASYLAAALTFSFSFSSCCLASQIPVSHSAEAPFASSSSVLPGHFPAFLDALVAMQARFFCLWQGRWPTAIEWTSAVMSTHVAGALTTLSRSFEYLASSTLSEDVIAQENLMNRYISQISAFYFGEDSFELRLEAYDDMLWVVLDWLEHIRFINRHSTLRYATSDVDNTSSWYAVQFIPSFSHRARVFYELASKGWDTTLCGGGMVWSPYLLPYKNAITNELYISASINMYLYFPGDSNTSPFSNHRHGENDQQRRLHDMLNSVNTSLISLPVSIISSLELPPAKAHDAIYLRNAVEGYKWLKSSHMTNSRGLYTDGFHVSFNKTCSIRSEEIFTYNQGVILTGLRGLFLATAAASYLTDGHDLIRAVIDATGWDISTSSPRNSEFAGLGRNGVLEERCDQYGSCSQNSQTFKGIFFHHLTGFCAPFPASQEPLLPLRNTSIEAIHVKKCREYKDWIIHNAAAANITKDQQGLFGMWWGRPYPDYETFMQKRGEIPLGREGDVNERGRGRTVETQGGGLAVLRAAVEAEMR